MISQWFVPFDRVAVMHKGHIVELGNVEDIYEHPLHPYTKALLSAIPHPDPIGETARIQHHYIQGDIDYAQGTIHQLNETHQLLGTDAQVAAWQRGEYGSYLD